MSLAEAVEAVTKHLPEELASAESITRIVEVAGCFPDALSHHFGFECKLGPQAEGAVFILKIPPHPGREIISGTHKNIKLPQKVLSDSAWQRVREFSLRWADEGSALHRNVQSTWLEFDANSRCDEATLHKVFFFLEEYSNREKTDQSGLDYKWVSSTAIRLLRGEPLAANVTSNLARCFNEASGRAQVLQVGLNPSQIDVIKLGLYPYSKDQFLKYLEAIGWAGPAGELEAIVEPLYRFYDEGQVCLSIDVGEVVHTKVGIEFYFNGLSQSERQRAWPKLLGELVEKGLCAADKRDALLRFPGYSIEDFLYRRVFFRGLHHIKVVYQPGLPPQAKAYIGATIKPLSAVTSLSEESV